jgi:hypothetical protein
MNEKPKQSAEPIRLPIGRMIVIFGAVGVTALVAMGAWQMMGAISVVNTPIVGEWRAANKPWRLDFRSDKTVVSSMGPAKAESSQAWTSSPGDYSVDYFGTLWVTLDNGHRYTATLSTESPNRFDLIDSEHAGVTVFDRASQAAPN